MKKAIAVVLLLSIILVLAGCSKPEDALVGKWYYKDNDLLACTFFSDGTCNLRGHYGTGNWSVEDGVLKIITFYGETMLFEYEVSGDTMKLSAKDYFSELYRK